MSEARAERRFRVHLTNVTGVGATQLVKSLLTAIEDRPGYRLEEMYLPGSGAMAAFRPQRPGIRTTYYERTLPNSLSRLWECTAGAAVFDAETPLLVLGDLPLRSRSKQTVFVHNRFMVDGDSSSGLLFAFKSRIYRWVFAANLKLASAIIVQTDLMKAELVARYPERESAIHVIRQPPPQWLLEAGLRRDGRIDRSAPKVSLFYPAASYPHKNHLLLASISGVDQDRWSISGLTLTIAPGRNPNRAVPWIECVGLLAEAGVIEAYRRADALLFLSTKESYGVPLVEAMSIGLPIVCPDLPYAHALCGDVAIYFDPSSVESLRAAVALLSKRLDSDWWPDWSRQLRAIPSSWNEVADDMLAALFR